MKQEALPCQPDHNILLHFRAFIIHHVRRTTRPTKSGLTDDYTGTVIYTTSRNGSGNVLDHEDCFKIYIVSVYDNDTWNKV